MFKHHTLLIGARRALCATLLAGGWSGSAFAVPERTADSIDELLARVTANAGGALASARSVENAYFAIQARGPAPLLSDDATAEPAARARFFLSLYGGLAGVTDPVAQLQTRRVSQDRNGRTHVHLDQVHRGLPVFGARLVVHMSHQGITGLGGVFVDGLESLSTAPGMAVAALRERALAAVRKQHPRAQALAIDSTRLMIYRSGLLKGVEGRNHLAYEAIVSGTPGDAIRERIILDANSGAVLNRISEIHSVLNREIYTPTMDVPPLLTEGSALAPAPTTSSATSGATPTPSTRTASSTSTSPARSMRVTRTSSARPTTW